MTAHNVWLNGVNMGHRWKAAKYDWCLVMGSTIDVQIFHHRITRGLVRDPRLRPDTRQERGMPRGDIKLV